MKRGDGWRVILKAWKIFTIIILFIVFINPASSLTADKWVSGGNESYRYHSYDIAIEKYDKAIAMNPNLKEAWNYKGLALYKKGQYEEANLAFEGAVTIDTNFKEAWYNKGSALAMLGNYNKAIEAYDKAIAIDQKFKDAWLYKGLLLGIMGEYNTAMEVFDGVIVIDPKYKEAWLGKGMALGALGEYRKAVEAYDMAIAIDRMYKEAWGYKGDVLYELGRYEEAIEAYDRARAYFPSTYVNPAFAAYDKTVGQGYERAVIVYPSGKETKMGQLAVNRLVEQEERNWTIMGGVAVFVIACMIMFTNKIKNKLNATANGVAGSFLFLALFSPPYDYYILLRWVVFIAGISSVLISWKQKKDEWTITFGIIALIFNPIIPLHLSREIWTVIDIAAGAIFIGSIFIDYRNEYNTMRIIKEDSEKTQKY